MVEQEQEQGAEEEEWNSRVEEWNSRFRGPCALRLSIVTKKWMQR